MSKALEVNESNFDQEVKQSDTPVVVVDFWAPWCGPCRKLSFVIDEIADDFGDKIKVVKVNTDENLKIAQEYSISGIPSILVFKGGEAVERLVGVMAKASLVSNIEKHL
jgi:thioredoxin 1